MPNPEAKHMLEALSTARMYSQSVLCKSQSLTFVPAWGVLYNPSANLPSTCQLCVRDARYRFGYGMWRRSRALKDVPGPEYHPLVGVMNLLSVRDMHRVCTEYAEEYGPIFKLRLLTFHVSPLHMTHRYPSRSQKPCGSSRTV